MTDRIHSITLVLEENVRVDDAEYILNACRMLKGVISADGNIADFDSHMAESRARTDMLTRVCATIKSEI